MNQPARITEKTKLAEVMDLPGAAEILTKYRLPCLRCPLASFEMGELELGQLARAYGLDLEGLLRELNEVVARAEGR
jgi:hypothetical protein